MKFDLEKFMKFELGDGMSISRCIKCSVAYAMGKEPDAKAKDHEGLPTLYSFLYPISILTNQSRILKEEHDNWFTLNGNKELAFLMDEAEQMLWDDCSGESVKKFVIEGMVRLGIIDEAPQLTEEKENVAV
jgi:hypothetical protein